MVLRIDIDDEDTGMDALLINYDDMNDLVLSVGIHQREGNERYPNGPRVAEVASWHEFGTTNLPMRSFARRWSTTRRQEIIKKMDRWAQDVTDGRAKPVPSSTRSGRSLAAPCKRSSTATKSKPADQPSTVARKGQNVVLYETGRLVSAIRHKVSK